MAISVSAQEVSAHIVPQTVPPVFIKHSDTGDVTHIELCAAVANIVGSSHLQGVQRIQNLWRIYVSDKKSRVDLYIKKKLLIKGKHVDMFDQNPYETRQNDVNDKMDKLTIKNLPFSVSNDQICQMLKENKVVTSSPVRYCRIRNQHGHLTKYMNGDRYVFVKPFDPPLARNQKVDKFSCVVIHHGKEVNCKACGMSGHRVGDEQCPAKPKPDQDIMVFKGYIHPLSNQYACQLQVYDKNFKSLEHAYYFRVAMEFGLVDLAENIQNAIHAGEAKRLSKQIAPAETLFDWEKENLHVMVHLLQEKAKQCLEFKNCLLDNKGKIIAEANPDKLWGTGLSPYISANCLPDYWPGQNLLGAMLMELVNNLPQDMIDNQDKDNVNDGNDDSEVRHNDNEDDINDDVDRNPIEEPARVQN